jgi:hypothetical protein
MGPAQEELISERGGFSEPELRLAGEGEAAYCDAEILRIRYDEASDLLRVADARVLLDCCGQRSLRVERAGGVIEITQRDEPEPGAGRCAPGCAYDFAVGLQIAPRPSPVTIRLLREIDGAPRGPAVIWEGVVDPARGAAPVVLDETPAARGCDTPAP